jgi:hypothetical protein
MIGRQALDCINMSAAMVCDDKPSLTPLDRHEAVRSGNPLAWQ